MVGNIEKKSNDQDDFTIVSRTLAKKLNAARSRKVSLPQEEREPVVQKTGAKPPWLIQQYLEADVDLDAELVRRYPNMQLMSMVHFREIGRKHKRAIAMLEAQDKSASLLFEVDVRSGDVQFAYTLGSMLSQRFQPEGINAKDRAEWVRQMRLRDETPAFLWGQRRWENDFAVCVCQRYFTNFYAFSPNQAEAAARVTPDVTNQLVNWLEGLWKPEKSPRSTRLSW